jgi:hypothetical protein
VSAPRKYAQAQRDEALKVYEQAGPTAVEKQLGIPKNTVMRWAKETGTRTIRDEVTRKAVEAKVLDGKARRLGITERLYGQAEKILDDLEAEEFKTILKGEYGKESTEVLDFIPANDRKTLLQAVGTAMATTARLESVDSDNGVEAAKNMISGLAEQLGLKDAG